MSICSFIFLVTYLRRQRVGIHTEKRTRKKDTENREKKNAVKKKIYGDGYYVNSIQIE